MDWTEEYRPETLDDVQGTRVLAGTCGNGRQNGINTVKQLSCTVALESGRPQPHTR